MARYLTRNADDAIAWASKQIDDPSQDWTLLCQSFCRQAYGVDAWAPSAAAAWAATPDAQRFEGDDPSLAPRGALLYYGGLGKYGHVALAVGRSTRDFCLSNDYARRGEIDRVGRDFDGWGADYLGWSMWTPFGLLAPPDRRLWDGIYPSGAGSDKASSRGVANPQAWRWACRMADLGWYEGEPQKKGVQGWPFKAVERMQKARGMKVTGDYSPELYRQVFGIDAP